MLEQKPVALEIQYISYINWHVLSLIFCSLERYSIFLNT